MRKFIHVALGLVLSVVALLSLAACQQACTASVAEFAIVRGISYLPANVVPSDHIVGTAIAEAELGPVYDTINTYIQSACAPTPAHGNYSSYLAAGVKLYTIQGYQPWFRLAVKHAIYPSNQPITILESWGKSSAKKGSDVVQLDQNVSAIFLYPPSSQASSSNAPLASVSASQQVAQLIALFNQAPVQSRADTGSTNDVLVFRFKDGTITSLVYDPTTGWTNKGVLLPSTFASMLTAKGK